MQRLELSGAVRHIYGSLGVKRLTFNNCTLCPHCIYVFSIYLRTNSDLCHLQHQLIGFYNRDEKCLQRGTDWGFKYSGLRFVFKGLNISMLVKFTTLYFCLPTINK